MISLLQTGFLFLPNFIIRQSTILYWWIIFEFFFDLPRASAQESMKAQTDLKIMVGWVDQLEVWMVKRAPGRANSFLALQMGHSAG